MPVAPTVGVVIANHNNSDFIAKAIESVARQTVRNIRAVVVDDASTDRSDETIRECLAQLGDARFRYTRLESNVGQGGAIRRGLAELDTPFVCFLDSDDLWYDDFIARHIAAHMNADFPVALTYCDSHIIDADGRMLAGTAWWFDAVPTETSPRKIDAALIPAIDPKTGELAWPANGGMTFHPHWTPDGATNSTASMMFRRSFVDLVLVPPDHDLRLYVDFYLSTFAALLTGVIAIHQALYAYRMHGRNKHSNATVMGGRYNSSTRAWESVRTPTLQLIRTVLESDAEAFRMAFGEGRHGEAVALIAGAIGEPPAAEPPKPSRSGVLGRLFGKADPSSVSSPAQSSAVFAGVARDCATHLPGVLATLDRFAASYAETSFVFVVSDSADDSLPILQRWLGDSRHGGRRGKVIDLGVLADRLPKRTERIAYARNACLDEIRRSDWAGYDHLVMADLDDVLAFPARVDGFAEAVCWLDGSPARAGVLANAAPRYYDVWALRHDRWCPQDCWHPIWGRPEEESFEAAKFREVFARQIEIPAALPPIAVRSAFGGLGIYRLSAALAARYCGLDGAGREVSEHVAFNEAIARSGGELCIFPPLQVRAPAQHLYRACEFSRRWRLAMLAQRAAEMLRPPWRRFFPPS